MLWAGVSRVDKFGCFRGWCKGKAEQLSGESRIAHTHRNRPDTAPRADIQDMSWISQWRKVNFSIIDRLENMELHVQPVQFLLVIGKEIRLFQVSVATKNRLMGSFIPPW